MSHPKRKVRRAELVPAGPTANQEPTLEGVMRLFAPGAISEMMIEGFARAFERRISTESIEFLTDALQLTADLRLFKEGLFLTAEQAARMLQVSERTFDTYKKEKKIEVDPHIGPGSLRYSLFSILEARSKLIREAKAKKAV